MSLFFILYLSNKRIVILVSSAIIISEFFKVLIARIEISSRFPIGVETTNNFPELI